MSRVGLSFGAFRTVLVGDGPDKPLEEVAAGAVYERRLKSKVTLQLSAGAVGWSRVSDGTAHNVLHGGFVGIGGSSTLVEQAGAVPFVMLSISFSASLAFGATDSVLFAADFRGAVTAGYTLFKRFTPYLTARVFGGPVVRGAPEGGWFAGDRYHFQVGSGLVVGLPGNFDLSVEVAPLGEQRVSAGVGYSF